jgi:hypothetical protein
VNTPSCLLNEALNGKKSMPVQCLHGLLFNFGGFEWLSRSEDYRMLRLLKISIEMDLALTPVAPSTASRLVAK